MHLGAGQKVEGQPVHRGVLPEHIGQRQREYAGQHRYLRSSSRLWQNHQRQQHRQNAEIFGIDLEGIAAPVMRLALERSIVAAEFGHDQRGDFLGVQRPGACVGQLLLGRPAPDLFSGSPL